MLGSAADGFSAAIVAVVAVAAADGCCCVPAGSPAAFCFAARSRLDGRPLFLVVGGAGVLLSGKATAAAAARLAVASVAGSVGA